MGLREELGLPNPITNLGHEAAMNLVLTGEMLTKEAGRILRPFGLTGAQFNVLMLLENQSADGCLDQTRLGRLLVVNRSNITGLVDRMETARWVKRIAKAGDRRVKGVQITPAGRRLLKRTHKVYFQRVEEVLGRLPGESCADICRLLEQVRMRLGDE